MSRRTAFGALVVVVMLAMVAAAVPASAAVSGSQATTGTLTIWTDKDRRRTSNGSRTRGQHAAA